VERHFSATSHLPRSPRNVTTWDVKPTPHCHSGLPTWAAWLSKFIDASWREGDSSQAKCRDATLSLEWSRTLINLPAASRYIYCACEQPVIVSLLSCTDVVVILQNCGILYVYLPHFRVRVGPYRTPDSLFQTIKTNQVPGSERN